MRKLATAVVAAGLFFGGMGVAVADTWHSLALLKTTGARFEEGKFKWEPAEREHGAFHVKGKLRDIGLEDDHNVYLQVKVHGYGWNRFDGVQKKTVWLDKVVYDGATRYTTSADVRVCQNRGSLRPDNCSPASHFERK
ncbi:MULTISPECIES: hypothetical protein [Streptomyces]|uniref:Uncharacterized protein n=1 Tax=Streptomyces venezuelae (strain ATCC 10712 / CBS 650.69 / DSM 40230 / JCM 4526 / NBRC 13096 / PD 04745) TaxID=953739 RepID=F2REI1_STRVP|nr:hypothetical protein [Streptomyces venezuelae]APE22852.1 hypothetical protein vnz_18780 [Streptomyces venezuelae]QES00232.1 hypothetical protein DEJ43_19035 [Streptomyces venezuelae ATCC 10712]CCA57104.1 hypothetical protein SVEN_3818 [Streptomyces venezuelae ATCC 10712]